ncbi:MAG: YdcF family protein, partial [Candidatus Omnitrophota bacterium]
DMVKAGAFRTVVDGCFEGNEQAAIEAINKEAEARGKTFVQIVEEKLTLDKRENSERKSNPPHPCHYPAVIRPLSIFEQFQPAKLNVSFENGKVNLEVLQSGSLSPEQKLIFIRRLEKMLTYQPQSPPVVIWITPRTNVGIQEVGSCRKVAEYHSDLNEIHLYPICIQSDEQLADLLNVSVPQAQKFLTTCFRDEFNHAWGLNQEEADIDTLSWLRKKENQEYLSANIAVLNKNNSNGVYPLGDWLEVLENPAYLLERFAVNQNWSGGKCIINLEDLQRLINFLAERDIKALYSVVPMKFDLMLVLGNSQIKSIEMAVRAYTQELVRRFLIAGGMGRETAMLIKNVGKSKYEIGNIEEKTEAEVFKEIMMANGISEQAFLPLETNSTNIGENIRYALNILEEYGLNAVTVTSIIISQNPVVQKRIGATWERIIQEARYKAWKNAKFVNFALYVPNVSQMGEEEFWYWLKMVLGEMHRLNPNVYGSKGQGFIVDVEIPGEIKAIYRRLILSLFESIDSSWKAHQEEILPLIREIPIELEHHLGIVNLGCCFGLAVSSVTLKVLFVIIFAIIMIKYARFMIAWVRVWYWQARLSHKKVNYRDTRGLLDILVILSAVVIFRTKLNGAFIFLSILFACYFTARRFLMFASSYGIMKKDLQFLQARPAVSLNHQDKGIDALASAIENLGGFPYRIVIRKLVRIIYDGKQRKASFIKAVVDNKPDSLRLAAQNALAKILNQSGRHQKDNLTREQWSDFILRILSDRDYDFEGETNRKFRNIARLINREKVRKIRGFVNFLKENKLENIVIGVSSLFDPRANVSVTVKLDLKIDSSRAGQADYTTSSYPVSADIYQQAKVEGERLAKNIAPEIEAGGGVCARFIRGRQLLCFGEGQDKLEVYFSGPEEIGANIYRKNFIVDSISFRVYSVYTCCSLWMLAYDRGGAVYGPVEVLDELARGKMRIIGDGANLSFSCILGLLDWKHRLGLRMSALDQGLIKEVIEAYRCFLKGYSNGTAKYPNSAKSNGSSQREVILGRVKNNISQESPDIIKDWIGRILEPLAAIEGGRRKCRGFKKDLEKLGVICLNKDGSYQINQGEKKISVRMKLIILAGMGVIIGLLAQAAIRIYKLFVISGVHIPDSGLSPVAYILVLIGLALIFVGIKILVL